MHMIFKHWKLILGVVIGVAIVVAVVAQVTRSVPPFYPPQGRQITAWGSLDAGTAGKLQAVLDEEVNTQKVPGFQAYLRTADGKTWSGTSGTTDLARKNPMQRDDVLRIGSSTKIFTAVIILKQVETGQLGLEDPLSKWSPEIPEADAITVRNLLNHTSGIEEIISKGIMKSIIPSTVWSEDDLLKLIASSPLKFTPGSQWEYSNSNYILLGMIAERVSGKTMLQLYHEVIIDPLNLKHTCFVPYEPAPAALVAGYERDLSHIPGMLDIAPGNTSWATLAFSSGAMVSTAEDLGAFLDHLMAGDLLSAASMQEMTTFVASVNPGIPAEDGYGLGLMRLDVNGQELIGHIGWFMGATSIAMASPDRGYTIVITSNLSTPDLVEVLARLQDVILIQTNRTSGANHGHAEI